MNPLLLNNTISGRLTSPLTRNSSTPFLRKPVAIQNARQDVMQRNAGLRKQILKGWKAVDQFTDLYAKRVKKSCIRVGGKSEVCHQLSEYYKSFMKFNQKFLFFGMGVNLLRRLIP